MPGGRLSSRMPAKSTKNNFNVKTLWAQASLSLFVYTSCTGMMKSDFAQLGSKQA